jgi:hypothetical protein
MQVEFVDRYTDDPRGRPTEFNACRHCEAMGCYPGATIEADFIMCLSCGGTGRVSVWRNLSARLPRWLWKGLRFMWHTNTARDMHPQEWSRWRILRVTFGCAFLVDLGLWQP